MSKITKRIELVNEKGNESAKARSEIKQQVEKQLLTRLEDLGLERTPNTKKLVLELGVDHRTGEPIYARIDVTITMADQDEVKEKKTNAKKSEKVEVEVPNLFD